MTLFERTSRRVALTPAGERLLADARAVLAAMEQFAATASELAAAPSTLALGYCHGSERAAMLAIGAFHAVPTRRRGARRRADVAADPRRRSAPARSPPASSADRSPDPERVDSQPLARVPVDHVAVPPDPPAGRRRRRQRQRPRWSAGAHRRPRRGADSPRRDRGLLRVSGSAAALDHPRRGPGRAGARPGRSRHRHRLAQRLAGRAGRRPSRTSPCVRCDPWRCSTRSTSSGEPATDAATTAQFVQALADSCASLAAVTSAS